MSVDERPTGYPKKEVEFYFWIHRAFRKYVEVSMDVILVGLVLIDFVLIGKIISSLGMSLLDGSVDFSFIVSEIMFIFILIEVLRLLIIYFEFHKVAIDTMVELAIVATLRELILKGVTHIDAVILGITSVFLLVLGVLLRFGGIRCEQEVFSVYRPFLSKGVERKQKTSARES